MTSISFSKQISQNCRSYKILLVSLFAILLLLLFIQFILPKFQHNKEGFEVRPTPARLPSPTIPSKLLKKIFFMNDFKKSEFKKVYEAEMDDKRYVSFWIRDSYKSYFPVGQITLTTDVPATIADINENEHSGLKYLVKGGSIPVDFEKIWDNKNDASMTPLSIWKVIPQKDHIAMSDIVVAGFDKPLMSTIRCLPIEVLQLNKKINKAVWKNPLPRSKTKDGEDISPPNSFSIWNIGDESNGFFFAKDSYQRPANRLDKIYNISDAILNNQELDPSDGQTILKITLKV